MLHLAITNILAGITIAVVVTAAKTLFESIEHIPTIPSKIGKIVNDGKSRKKIRNFEMLYESTEEEIVSECSSRVYSFCLLNSYMYMHACSNNIINNLNALLL